MLSINMFKTHTMQQVILNTQASNWMFQFVQVNATRLANCVINRLKWFFVTLIAVSGIFHLSAWADCASGDISTSITTTCSISSGTLTIEAAGSIIPSANGNDAISSSGSTAILSNGSIIGASGSPSAGNHPGRAGGMGINNTGTISSLTNNATLFGGQGGADLLGNWTAGNGGSALQNTGTINNLTNNYQIIGGAGGVEPSDGTSGSGSSGIITSGNITSLTNAAGGTIAGGNGGLLTNSGANGSGGIGINVMSPSVITTLTNNGVISGGVAGSGGSGGQDGYAISNTGTITTLTNTGTISGKGIFNQPFFFIAYPFGVITTLNNQQGSNTSALAYVGALPVNYNIIIASSSNYGRLAVTNASGTTTFGISSLSAGSSIVSGTAYTSVLSGIPRATLVGGSTGFISGNSNNYSYILAETSANSGIWNLTVSAYSGGGSGGGSSGGSSGGSGGGSGGGGGGNAGVSTGDVSTAPVITNVTTGISIGLNSIGVTANPVLSGGTLVLTQGERSAQPLSILGAGSTITATSTGAAQLSGVLSGTGSLTFNGTGTTVLSGANTYSGGTTIASGIVSLLNGALGSGEVYVAPSAQLGGTGTIAAVVTVAGLLKPGNSPGYLATSANVTMMSGSVYQQDIAGTMQASAASPVGATGYYSYLKIAGGQFVINAGATLTPALSNLFNALELGYGSTSYTPVLGDRFRIITADGGIVGKFSSVTQPAELAAGTQFLPFYNMAGTNSVDLAVIPTSYKNTIAVASGNKNAQSVGVSVVS